MLEVLAPAKINLFLQVLSRRPDGYHEIETFFQKIDLQDRLEFRLSETAGIELDIRGIPLDHAGMQNNLVARAYHALAQQADRSLPGVKVQLRKRIPAGGGLGGGSSDAAATLDALNRLFDLGFPREVLQEVGIKLGADVPFFLEAPSAIGRNLGEVLTPVRIPSSFWAVLAFPEYGVSTAEVYRHFDPNAQQPGVGMESLLNALVQGNLPAALSLLFNGMENLAFAIRPELGQLRKDLEEVAGQPVRMSGSGSTMYTLAQSAAGAHEMAERWKEELKINSACAQFLA